MWSGSFAIGYCLFGSTPNTTFVNMGPSIFKDVEYAVISSLYNRDSFPPFPVQPSAIYKQAMFCKLRNIAQLVNNSRFSQTRGFLWYAELIPCWRWRFLVWIFVENSFAQRSAVIVRWSICCEKSTPRRRLNTVKRPFHHKPPSSTSYQLACCFPDHVIDSLVLLK